jgi:hypothetical protein
MISLSVIGTQGILIRPGHNPILINRELKQHLGIPLFLLSQSPDSQRQPLWLARSRLFPGRT